jgi:DNA-binding NarL/FixJ family response regulator
VLDLRMRDIPGLEVLCGLRRSCPDVQVLILTASHADIDVIAALAAGASGYLLKDSRGDQVALSVLQAAEGQMVLSAEIARALVERVRAHAEQRDTGVSADLPGGSVNQAQAARDVAALTPREMEVLRLIIEGADNTAIGRALWISPHTVKHYVANIFEKLGVRSRVQAAVYAMRAGPF